MDGDESMATDGGGVNNRRAPPPPPQAVTMAAFNALQNNFDAFMARYATDQDQNTRQLAELTLHVDRQGDREALLQHVQDRLGAGAGGNGGGAGAGGQAPPQGGAPPPRPAQERLQTIVRPTPFEYKTAEAWPAWRVHFQSVQRTNDWPDVTARHALQACMQGTAANTVMDIDPMNYFTLAAMLDAYEERFLPAALSQLAKQEFDAAHQRNRESVLEWHARLRSLFRRAYPNTLDQTQLIRRFMLGVNNEEVQKAVLRDDPQNYARALQVAQNERAVLNAAKGAQSRLPAPANAMVTAVSKEDAICHACGVKGHFKRDCPMFQGGKKKGAVLRKFARTLQNDSRKQLSQINALLEMVEADAAEAEAEAVGEEPPAADGDPELEAEDENDVPADLQ